MRHSSAARIILASSENELPVFNLQAYAPIGDNHYSAVFSSTKRNRPFQFEDYAEKVSNAFGGKMSLVANSLFRSDETVFRGILAPHSESQRFEADKLKEQGFRATAANLYTDESDAIWRLVGEGDNKQLVRVTPENYEGLLRTRRSSMPLHAAEGRFVTPEFGDYAYAYVPELRAFDFGVYGTNKNTAFIVSRKYQRKFNVDNVQIMEAAASEPSLRMEMARKWDELEGRKAAFADYLTFLAMMYGKNSEYYKANEEAILNSRVM